MQDIRVRQAIQYAYDSDAVLVGAYGGLVPRSAGVVQPGTTFARQQNIINTRDVEKARALLAEAGAEGLTLNLVTLTDSTSINIAQIIQASLGEAGINVVLQPTEDAAYWALGDKTVGEDYKSLELVLQSFAGGIDPTENLVWFRADQIGVYNWSFFDEPEFETLYQQGLTERDPEKRRAIFNRMEDLMEALRVLRLHLLRAPGRAAPKHHQAGDHRRRSSGPGALHQGLASQWHRRPVQHRPPVRTALPRSGPIGLDAPPALMLIKLQFNRTVPVPRKPRYDLLFQPLRIGPKIAKNRFFQVPHASGMTNAAPHVRAAFRGMKAEGGWGVVCTGACSVDPTSDDSPFPFASLWDDRDIRAHALMTEAVHAHGALAGVELWHGGAAAVNRTSRHAPLSPSGVPWMATHVGFMSSARPRIMDAADIRDLIRWHAEAAVRAEEAGFDIIYVYAGMGYLPYQFMLSDYNHRTDAYGGSVRNRVRLTEELIDAVREATTVAAPSPCASRCRNCAGAPRRWLRQRRMR